nr:MULTISPECIES: LysR family transcriptional regulator [unclassified Novosphingobium]
MAVLDPDTLAVFVAVADHGHFQRAADALGIAQSVASKRLQRLEDALGARLIERGSRMAVAPTRAGMLFLPQARAALETLARTQRVGRALARGEAGPIQVGYVFSAAMAGVLPRLIATLAQVLPGVEVMPALMETPDQLKALADGRIDLAIVRPRPSWPAGCVEVARQREGLLVAMGETSPLAAASPLRAADLAGQTFLTPQFHEEVGLAQTVAALAKAAGLPPPPIRRTADFITAASLAAAGQGVILAPASLARLHLEGLVFRPLADHAATVDLVTLASPQAPPGAVAALTG